MCHVRMLLRVKITSFSNELQQQGIVDHATAMEYVYFHIKARQMDITKKQGLQGQDEMLVYVLISLIY